MQYTVTSLNNYIKNMFTMDAGLNSIYVKGEVSNCKYHTSGHIYFTIKDSKSQIACVMFAGQRAGLNFRLEEGQSVVVYGNVSVYERDGKYQLYASNITRDGLGLLYQKYEELKRILSLKGYFDEEHKKPIPKYAKRIGIVTARTGAAIQDIINVSTRRNPFAQLILAPALVQGEMAAPSIVKGIHLLQEQNVDVIIVGRGGGSIEDLWAFNEEIVAKVVYDCDIPIISAVGHETDTTIIDYVSDMRAPTPSAAAELAVFDYYAFERTISDYKYVLNNIINRSLNDYINIVENKKNKLVLYSPIFKMSQLQQRSDELYNRMNQLINSKLERIRHSLDVYIERLNGVSPLNKLKSGFVMVRNSKDNLVKSVDDISLNDKINISFIDGDISAKVEKIDKIER